MTCCRLVIYVWHHIDTGNNKCHQKLEIIWKDHWLYRHNNWKSVFGQSTVALSTHLSPNQPTCALKTLTYTTKPHSYNMPPMDAWQERTGPTSTGKKASCCAHMPQHTIQRQCFNWQWHRTFKKVHLRQTCLVSCADICDRPPPNLKIPPIVMTPHKFYKLWVTLDLSLKWKLKFNTRLVSVNNKIPPTALVVYLIRWGMHCHGSSISLHKQTQMLAFPWRTLTSRTFFGV